MHRGWIKLYRKISDNVFWDEKPFSKGQAWVDLLILTNHKDGRIKVSNGSYIDISVGECGYSKLALADKWGWSRGKVDRFLNQLETRNMIQQKNVHNHCVISITNWIEYQTEQQTVQQTGQQTGQQKVQQTGQQTIQQTDTNKNDKNEKNEKNNIFINYFEEFWQLYPRENRRDKQGCKKIYCKYVKSEEKKAEFETAFKNYTESDKFKKGYIQNSITWFRDWQTWLDFSEYEGVKVIENNKIQVKKKGNQDAIREFISGIN